MRISKTITESREICGNNIQRIKRGADGKITGEVSEFKYLENSI
jgi:hypothetical protein